ncbi:Arm DNA-binding domain-containing protein [Campylobacter sp. 19-13652]|uniref:Arm DNA-binding domain-containing protein n=1 Tax=Campylobacter sp. 19-13652 TaxID=2840180 RepID=UPI001C790D07|nr:Arm DNA-binding domain-containing protein [Campylobacter sp. 19-13652]BCX79947.1 hypothetical protein LBC_14090 [Campylobacter sp. 19-13652]
MLTDLKARKAKPQEKEYTLGDGNRLFLLVRPNGTKSWLFIYTAPNGKRAKLTLGRYPALGIAGARKLRDHASTLLNQSIDPREYHKALKADGKKEAWLQENYPSLHKNKNVLTSELLKDYATLKQKEHAINEAFKFISEINISKDERSALKKLASTLNHASELLAKASPALEKISKLDYEIKARGQEC